MTEEKNILQIFEKYKPNFVINAAAMTNVDGCEDDKDLCHKINVTAVNYLSRLVRSLIRI